MIIGVNNLHQIVQMNNITDPTLTVYEVDRERVFGGWSDSRILAYCYEPQEFGYTISPYRNLDAVDLAEPVEIMAQQALTSASAGEIMFVLEAQSDNSRLDATSIMEHADLFAEWTSPGVQCKRGTILRDDGKLYQALHDINDVAQAAHRPSETPTLWALKGDPSEEWPAWSQWMGVGDLYMTGDKCSSVDYSTPADEAICHWISTADNNIWRPGEHGWEKQTT